MRFKEFLQNEFVYGTGASMMGGYGFGGKPANIRDYYPELRPFDQRNVGKMNLNMMREELETLKKLRKLAMNIIEAINLGRPDSRRYHTVTYEGSPTNGMLYNVTMKDIHTGEGGRQFLTSEEIAWAKSHGIIEQNSSQMFNINLTTLSNTLNQTQATIDKLGSGLDVVSRGWDKFAQGAYKGKLSPVSPSDDVGNF